MNRTVSSCKALFQVVLFLMLPTAFYGNTFTVKDENGIVFQTEDIFDENERAFWRLIWSFKDEVADEDDLIYFWEREGPNEILDKISVDLGCDGPLSKERARELGIKTFKTLKRKINENQRIKPFLAQYPFRSNQIQVTITFFGEGDRTFGNGTIAHVRMTDDKILFYTDKVPEGSASFFEIFCEGAYEKALKKLDLVKEESFM